MQLSKHKRSSKWSENGPLFRFLVCWYLFGCKYILHICRYTYIYINMIIYMPPGNVYINKYLYDMHPDSSWFKHRQ